MNARVGLGSAIAARVKQTLDTLVKDEVASRLVNSDYTLWGSKAEPEAKKRLGWLQATRVSAPFVSQIAELRDEYLRQGINHFVLGGMGGSSLAPEVITATAGVDLTVLDSTDPDQVRAALSDRLSSTVVIISSKSGGTVETDSQRRVYETAFRDAGIDPINRIIIVTDPESPLHESAAAAGYRTFLADPTVGGRYSALTAFGLVPSGLAGADIGELLQDAESIMPILSEDSPTNPGLLLGAALAAGAPLIDKVGLISDGTPILGFGDWIEQLIAESTGKEGTGVLPVVLERSGYEAKHSLSDLVPVHLVKEVNSPPAGVVQTAGKLGAQFVLWEFATAVAGRILGINPFDQPDVESAKVAARGLLDSRPEPTQPRFVDQGVEVRGADSLLGKVKTLEEAIAALVQDLGDQGYVAIQAYVDRVAHPDFAELRDLLAQKTHRPTTFGWGPRFLHSTGQYHKGGAPTGAFLQLRTKHTSDLTIVGRPFTFGELITAQADGDATVLEEHGRPVLILTLLDPDKGLTAIARAIDSLKPVA
ncbi:glucose-6-phosphate isomerase [Lysinibacter sp. HNR]|uniref:glucose-6-phosphate isomerase n=1 Tax=Lysinibacter sp. HNR TaxID=3031408 RepID=UPI002434F53F|nr:glucose-6-phosphate isomerase [Lysinibacter sp. HNR]WGD36189.1 glucose-6-phosphate isomerase [Lysinibacter sp. HNR]